MQKNISIKLLPSEAVDESIIKNYISQLVGIKKSSVSGFTILKHSIDARSKQVWVNLTLQAFIDEPFQPRKLFHFNFHEVNNSSKKVIVIGAGPAGLFAALKLLE